MPTEVEAHSDVMQAILADPNRSLENAISCGIRAGIAAERERIRIILEMPTPEGLQRAAIAMALANVPLEVVASTLALYDVPPAPVSEAEVRARRALFKLVENESKEERVVGKNP